ncbi:hypothetical protein [Gordonia shandongensis]|uniref:hypothetical protein n=1 Tax=Gordonia shandongensis TaxID=376351 RepID=UPI00047B306D|nr:hypothetical protein [Gordonia shandongensis]
MAPAAPTWKHLAVVVGVVVLIAVIATGVILLAVDPDESTADDHPDNAAVEARYRVFADAVSRRSADPGICSGRREAAEKLSEARGWLSGLGTAGSEVRSEVHTVHVDGDTATVDGSLNSMGTDLPLPLDLRRVDGVWCAWR